MSESLSQNQAVLDAAPNSEVIAQDKVNYLVSQAKQAAYEKGRQEALAEAQKMQQSEPKISEEKLNELVDQKLNAIQQQYTVQQIVGKHNQAMEQGRQTYADFDEAAGNIDFSATPGWLPVLNNVSNSADVVYELGKDPDKFSRIHALVATGQLKQANALVKKLSDSIAENKKAASQPKESAPEPLSKLKPSTASVDGGQMTASSIKAALNRIRKW